MSLKKKTLDVARRQAASEGFIIPEQSMFHILGVAFTEESASPSGEDEVMINDDPTERRLLILERHVNELGRGQQEIVAHLNALIQHQKSIGLKTIDALAPEGV